MEAAATIIDLRRASARERTARSRANRTHAKWEAGKINAREHRANRTHAKCEADKNNARECTTRSRANRTHAKSEADKISARVHNREHEACRHADANAIRCLSLFGGARPNKHAERNRLTAELEGMRMRGLKLPIDAEANNRSSERDHEHDDVEANEEAMDADRHECNDAEAIERAMDAEGAMDVEANSKSDCREHDDTEANERAMDAEGAMNAEANKCSPKSDRRKHDDTEANEGAMDAERVMDAEANERSALRQSTHNQFPPLHTPAAGNTIDIDVMLVLNHLQLQQDEMAGRMPLFVMAPWINRNFPRCRIYHCITEHDLVGNIKGIGAMSAEERMAASEKGYENGLGAMSGEERMAAYENGIGAMSAKERTAAHMKMGSEQCQLRQGWRRVKRDTRMGSSYVDQGEDGSECKGILQQQNGHRVGEKVR